MYPCRLLGFLLHLAWLRNTGARLVPGSRSFSGRANLSQQPLPRPAFLWSHAKAANDPHFISFGASGTSQRGRIGVIAAGNTCVSSLPPGPPPAANRVPLVAGAYTSVRRARRCATWRSEGGLPPSSPKSRVRISRRSSSCLSALPMRCGGSGDGFTWTETARQIRIEVLIDPSVEARDVVFQLQGRQLKVSVKGHKPLLQGTLRVGLHAAVACWVGVA